MQIQETRKKKNNANPTDHFRLSFASNGCKEEIAFGRFMLDRNREFVCHLRNAARLLERFWII